MTEHNYDDLKKRVDEIIKDDDSYILVNTPRKTFVDLDNGDFVHSRISSATSLQEAVLAIYTLKEAKRNLEKQGPEGSMLFMDLFAQIFMED